MDKRIDDAVWLANEYAKRPLQEIADSLGVSRNTVRNRMIAFGIDRRDHGEHFKGLAKPPEQKKKMSEARKAFWRNADHDAIGKNISLSRGGTGERKDRRFICLPDGRKVYEHQMVAEAMIGRRLRPGECVHHIDENPSNNSPKNLRVMPHGEHTKLHHPRQGITKACLNCDKPFYCKPKDRHQKGCSVWCGAQIRWGRNPNPKPQ